jgi:hypothetical protein
MYPNVELSDGFCGETTCWDIYTIYSNALGVDTNNLVDGAASDTSRSSDEVGFEDWCTFKHPVSPPSQPIPQPPPNVPQPQIRCFLHPNLPADQGRGANLLEQMETDQYARFRQENIFYPFASRSEWELASWLSSSSLSQKSINKFLHLDHVSAFLIMSDADPQIKTDTSQPSFIQICE